MNKRKRKLFILTRTNERRRLLIRHLQSVFSQDSHNLDVVHILGVEIQKHNTPHDILNDHKCPSWYSWEVVKYPTLMEYEEGAEAFLHGHTERALPHDYYLGNLLRSLSGGKPNDLVMILDDDDVFATMDAFAEIEKNAPDTARALLYWRVKIDGAVVPTGLWLKARAITGGNTPSPEHNNITTCSFAFSYRMAEALALTIAPYDRQDARNAQLLHAMADDIAAIWDKTLTAAPNGRMYGKTEDELTGGG